MENDKQGNNQNQSWLTFWGGTVYGSGPAEVMVEAAGSEVRAWLNQNKPSAEQLETETAAVFFVRRFNKARIELFSTTTAAEDNSERWRRDVYGVAAPEDTIAWDAVDWCEIKPEEEDKEEAEED